MPPSRWLCVVLTVVLRRTEPRAKSWVDDMDRRINLAIDAGWERNVVKAGSAIVIVTGWRAGSGFTNTIRVIRVPDTDKAPKRVNVLSTTSEGTEGTGDIEFAFKVNDWS